MDIATYLALTRRIKSRTQKRPTNTEPDSTNTESDSTNIQSTIIPTKQELITMTDLTTNLTEQEWEEFYDARPKIMDQHELQEKAGSIEALEKAENIVYYRIFTLITDLDGLYENALLKNKNKPWPTIQEVTLLMQLASYVARWLNKMYEDPQAVEDSEEIDEQEKKEQEKKEQEKKEQEIKAELSKRERFKNKTKQEIYKMKEKYKRFMAKSDRRKTLKLLQGEIGTRLGEIGNEQLEKKENDRVLDSNLIELFVTEGNYVQSPTILFTHVMTRLLTLYKPESITGEKFSKEMFNYLIADNDVIGSTSVAIQASGRSFGIKVGGNLGAFTFPCFKIKVEVASTAKTTRNRLIVSECQALLPKTREEHLRYALMNMNGRSVEATLDASLTAEFAAGVTSLIEDCTIDSLELNTYNLLPELKVSASVGMKLKGIMLQVTDPNPFHFNDSDEAVDTIFELVTSSNKKVSLRKAKPEICLWLYSALYNPGAGVVAEASGGSIALKSKGEVGMWGGVTHYTYQTLFSDRQIFKTQTTSMYFQQVYGLAQASAGTSSTEKEKKKQYEWVNSLFYESVFMYWQDPEKAKPTSSQLVASKASGYSRGHTILMDSIDLFYKDNTNNKRIVALSKKLGINSSIIEKFLKDNQSLLSDIWKVQNKPDAVFLEATFIPQQDSDKSMEITLVKKEGHPFAPDENSFKKFKKVFVPDTKSPVSGVLQSLRLRTMIKGSETLTQNKFKFCLNVGDQAQLGFNLGRIEDGGSIKLTDLIIQWYDKSGKVVKEEPKAYVPTSFLFM